METYKIKTYKYRWIILFIFMLMMAMQQLLWITFAAITSDTAAFYKISELDVGLLSMVFMVVYIFVSIPASWIIDTFGFRIGVGIGALLTGIFGLLRGVFAANYTLVLIFQIGIAIGQPFVVNAVTTVSTRWFPIRERGLASGLSWLAGYSGLIIGLVLTPYLIASGSIPSMLVIYGAAAFASAILFILLTKENPPTPQCKPEEEERSLVFDGLKQMLKKKDFLMLMIVFFVCLGIFNGISTWIEDILKPHGFTSVQAGIIGGGMIASGVIGSAVIPTFSDIVKNRVKVIILALAGSIPGLIGITYGTSFLVVMISACILGFFMLSCAPLGFQYGSEIAFPAPEGTSTGLLMMMGQIAGVIFIVGIDALKSPKTDSMSLPMNLLIAILIIGVLMCFSLKEPELVKQEVQENLQS
ncbi:MFS transporter [Clostridium sp. 19966]|uniref:MFS transporter n=1 Tax=Clostridium sp. 19966 TaxID=2768166 RepID=UPI0028DD6C6E|nr:MFS transporter [Clostridium sp. 19966]MDT8717789.1 MFS transporter [Clostridium sp. 19966]